MKKFVLMSGFVAREPEFVSNDLNTLMKSVSNLALKKFQVEDPSFLKFGKWEVNTNGSYAEIVVRNTINGDANQFIIKEVDFLFS